MLTRLIIKRRWLWWGRRIGWSRCILRWRWRAWPAVRWLCRTITATTTAAALPWAWVRAAGIRLGLRDGLRDRAFSSGWGAREGVEAGGFAAHVSHQTDVLYQKGVLKRRYIYKMYGWYVYEYASQHTHSGESSSHSKQKLSSSRLTSTLSIPVLSDIYTYTENHRERGNDKSYHKCIRKGGVVRRTSPSLSLRLMAKAGGGVRIRSRYSSLRGLEPMTCSRPGMPSCEG